MTEREREGEMEKERESLKSQRACLRKRQGQPTPLSFATRELPAAGGRRGSVLATWVEVTRMLIVLTIMIIIAIRYTICYMLYTICYMLYAMYVYIYIYIYTYVYIALSNIYDGRGKSANGLLRWTSLTF